MSEFTKIRIFRWYNKDCTIGRLTFGDFHCFTLELPDRDNQSNISCIPEGEYNFEFRISNRNGPVLELQNVEDRTVVQIHSGNYTSQILGCILVGDSVKHLNNDNIPDVTSSVPTLKKLIKLTGNSGVIKIYS